MQQNCIVWVKTAIVRHVKRYSSLRTGGRVGVMRPFGGNLCPTQSDSIERKKKVQNVQKRLRTNAVKAYHASALTVPLSGRVWADVKAKLRPFWKKNCIQSTLYRVSP